MESKLTDLEIAIKLEEIKREEWQQECLFVPNQNMTSATICANCGNEKFLHTKQEKDYTELLQPVGTKQEMLVEKMIPLQLKYNLDNMKQKAIEEAAKSYRSSTANKMAIEEVAFQEGAKSDAAKDYWYKKFWEDYESQFKNQEDGDN